MAEGPVFSDSTYATDLHRERNQTKREKQGVILDELSLLAYAPPSPTPMQLIPKSDENRIHVNGYVNCSCCTTGPRIRRPSHPAEPVESVRKASRVHTSLRIKLGLVTLSAVALTSCGLVQTAPPPAVAPALPAAPVAPAPIQSGQGSDNSGGGSQGSTSLGQRSSEGGYWPTTLQVGQNGSLGNVVVDGQGFTLYRFDKDTANPSKSNCSGQCAVTWPPVLTKNTISFRNLNANALGAIQRPDGTQQVTLGGWPLYRYSQDQVPGQATGQGVGGTWFAAAPNGSKAGS